MITKPPPLMTFASRTQFHVERPLGQRPFSVLNVKALVGAFNQEKALVGAFSMIVQLVVEPMEHYTALVTSRSLMSTTISVRGR